MDSIDNITASLEELEGALRYEMWMFRETGKRIVSQDFDTLGQIEKNLLVESFVIHTRVLVDFFYQDKIYPDDIVAQDLLPEDKNWKDIRPPLTKILEEARHKANKQLAHLSVERMELERGGKKGWNIIAISYDMEKVIKKFEEVKIIN